MDRVIKYGDALMVIGGAIVLIVAQPHPGWWFGWGVMTLTAVLSPIFRARLARP
ncbi:hypothetical protein AB0O01_09500 [Streptomyces sp. NPDC093252]|uniref:hypothetical protein n=1 Tax=Streptomyces sp. NPDC093252 TaxID=3154980 RepID=UPI003432D236